MNIGIFSGSFNPVHIGHLALANYLCEYEGLDQVWFMVSPRNPLKEADELMDDSLRLKLVQLAVEGYPKFGRPTSSFVCRGLRTRCIRSTSFGVRILSTSFI